MIACYLSYLGLPAKATSTLQKREEPKVLSIDQIESIEFYDVGKCYYKLKSIKIYHELQNVSGLININGIYYEKTIIKKYGI